MTVFRSIQLSAAVPVDDFVTFLDKLEGDISGTFDDISICGLREVAHDVHQRSFPATDRTGEHDAFVEQYPVLPAACFISQEISGQLQHDSFILGIQLKPGAVLFFPF